ncbi:hypothetical protein OF83DRAFT_1049810 [Amylostereum chailletii]|nr:hypothetical protein OF83DRAFT_1049810 [Amylostereum chailletii]
MSVPSTTVGNSPNPTIPAFTNDVEWFTAYAVQHMLSDVSRIYTYIFWIVLALIFLAYSLFHSFQLRSTVVGAYWTKWAIRRRTWRKAHALAEVSKSGQPHKQPIPLPSNAQILCLSILVVAAFAIMTVGPDYIAPTTTLWQSRRSSDIYARAYNLSDYYRYQPQYTIPKAWWTAGGRAGLVAFALFPLCVLFALKAPPFAIFANPFLTDLHFDKLMWLHRWSGRLIWLVTAIHTALWSVQLARDKRAGTGKSAYVYAWQYPKFIYAWTAFGLLTVLVILSFRPFRDRYYEAFYFLHVMFVAGTLVMSALHHPPVWWWCWAALMLWVGERIWRATRWLYTNGVIGSSLAFVDTTQPGNVKPPAHPVDVEAHTPASAGPLLSSNDAEENAPSNSKALYAHSALSHSQQVLLPSPPPPSVYVPPTGYGHVELLAGRTIRVRLPPPGYLVWAPGQHFLLCIPSVSRFLSHPFTSASISDEQVAGPQGRVIVFLIRAKNGWTRDLWDDVVALLSSGRKYPAGEKHPKSVVPATGVLMRAWVDGPFGSSVRTNWGAYSTAIIVSGGSGVSFGLAVLEYLALCMAGRSGKFLGGKTNGVFKTRRIRFVWIIREFGHLQWGATVLRRCQSFLPPEYLQLDVFVTSTSTLLQSLGTPVSGLAPPLPPFVRNDRQMQRDSVRRGSTHSHDETTESEEEAEEYVDLNYYASDLGDRSGLGHEEHALDFTNFDGDDDARLPGEASINQTIKNEGRSRRAFARQSRLSIAQLPPSDRLSVPPTYPPRRSVLSTPRLTEIEEVDLASPAAQMRTPLVVDTVHRSSVVRPTSSIYSSSSPIEEVGSRRSSVVGGSGPWTPLSRANSLRSLLPRTGRGARGQLIQLELEERELDDMAVIAEFTRPGRPKLDLIMEEEMKSAAGPLVVACCGPTTLNAVIRKAVASQIDPGRIRRGDLSGSIALVSEEFGY